MDGSLSTAEQSVVGPSVSEHSKKPYKETKARRRWSTYL